MMKKKISSLSSSISSSYFLFLMFSIISLQLFTHMSYALNLEGTTLLSLTRHWKLVPPPLKSTWNSSHSTPCSWFGVHCNHHNFLVSLNLSDLNLSGQLGPEIAYLNHLESIDLSYNEFSGSIPPALGNCSRLETLELSGNSFTGKIPESLGNLRKLRSLSLWQNYLVGSIPESLFRIPLLRFVYLNNNMLNGSIPSSVGNMSEVQILHLEYNQLSGTVPLSRGNCTSLQEIYINDNFLEGALPSSLNNLDQLGYLFVENNNFSGRIPFLGSCKDLQMLVLSNNRFDGGLPPELGNCSSLTSLAAVNCGLSGRIPSSLGLLTELTLLYLSDNQFSGEIPRELGKCKALTDLQMYGNRLEGGIPSELGMLDELQTLMLFTNRLSGEIPMSIWKIQTLQELIVYDNDLVGEIPVEITELKQLRNVSLFDNHFTGVIPQGLGINSSLTQVDFTRNNFSGPIPPNLCFRKQLRRLILGQNRFLGNIPSDIGNCSTLTRLILKDNDLTGLLPEFAQHSAIVFMDLSSNSISGAIPSSLGNLVNITSINLSLNKLHGPLPPEIGNLMDLEVFNLSHNHLEGSLPLELSRCRKLSTFDVNHNILNGTIPSSLSSLTELTVLDLSENSFEGGIQTSLFKLGELSSLQLGANQLEGPIPPSIGLELGAQNLRLLNLSRNRLAGRVPQELRNLKTLEQLDICYNNLSGSLETISELISLTLVNVSYNGFFGPLPHGLMKLLISSPSSFIGNPGLCIDCSPGGTGCLGDSKFKSCNMLSRKRGLKHAHIILIILGSFLFVVILVLATFYMFLRRKGCKKDFFVSAEEGPSSLLNQIMEATENLNDKYIIGRGAHGTVYKVTLGPNKVYALKKLTFVGYKGGGSTMVREIQTIGKVRHRNLVRFKDFWLRKEYGLILYSYMENGSLYDVLHGTYPPWTLEWDIRYNIATGIAQGLSYLHFDCDPPIIHRDIKPMNILLDSELEPHIADFGIAKLLDEAVASTPSSMVQGTIGYMAPENAFSTISGNESDVYAYGVILLELVTRRKVLDRSFGEEVDIVGWVRSIWNENEDIETIVDPALMDEFIDSSIMDQVIDVILLALRCTEKDPSRRPSMRNVVKQLTTADAKSRSKRT